MVKKTEIKGIVLVFMAGVLWGVVGVFAKQMEAYGSTPTLTAFLRVFFAFFIMLAVTAVKFGFAAFKINKRTLLLCALLGLVCHGIYNIFYMLAITLSGVTVGAVLLNVAPVVTFTASVMFLSERFTALKAVAVIVNIAGCVMTAASGGMDVGTVSILGVLCGVGSGVCYALTTIFVRLASEETNSFVISTYSYFFAAVFLFVYMIFTEHNITLTPQILSAGFLFALIPTAIAYFLYYRGIEIISESSKVPVISSVETAVAAVLGIFLYDEKLNLIGFIGIVLVFVSIVLMNKKYQLHDVKTN